MRNLNLRNIARMTKDNSQNGSALRRPYVKTSIVPAAPLIPTMERGNRNSGTSAKCALETQVAVNWMTPMELEIAQTTGETETRTQVRVEPGVEEEEPHEVGVEGDGD